MRIGFHLKVGRNEHSKFAFRLADLAAERGHEIALLSNSVDLPPKLGLIAPRWCNRIECESIVPLVEWSSGLDMVVWPCQVSLDCVSAVAKSGVRTVALFDWLYLSENDDMRQGYQAVDTLVATGKQSMELLKENWELDNAICIPWDVGNNIVRKNKLSHDDGRVTLLVPLHEELSGRVSSSIIDELEKMIALWPWLNIVATYSRSTMRGWVVSYLRRLRNKFVKDGRFRLQRVDHLSYQEYQAELIKSDLCLFPAQSDLCGSMVMESLCAGTPVVCYDVAPLSEIVHHDCNGLLVPCDLEYSWFGTPKAKEASFLPILAELFEKDSLTELISGTKSGLHERRRTFEAAWTKVFDSTRLKNK